MASSAGPDRWLRLVALAGIWGFATAAALAMARWTRLGPILVTVSGRHGVHAGDVAAFVVAYAVAAVITAALVHHWGRSGVRGRAILPASRGGSGDA